MSNLEAALALAAKGFRLIPLHNPKNGKCSCGKSACDRPGKHPRLTRWQHKASSNRSQLEKWFADWPDANLGIVTGKPSRVLVLDVDDKHANSGSTTLSELERTHTPLPQTLTATTGTGQHLYFAYPRHAIKCSVAKLGIGLDVRGENGFVVCPPSLHANGKQYAWVDESVAIADAPIWLLEKLTTEDESVLESEQIREGERNASLHAGVCELFRNGESAEDVLRHALAFNARRCTPPLPDAEVRSIVQRVEKTNKVRPVTIKSSRNPLRWFPFDVADFFADQNITVLTDTQLGWRTRLLAYAWANGARLQNDPDKLAKLANASSKDEFGASFLEALFDFEQVTEEGRLFLLNRGMANAYAECLTISGKRSDAGKASAKARIKKNRIAKIPTEKLKEAA